MDGPATYRPDLYYINTSIGGKTWHRRERVVSAWRWWVAYLLTPWRWERPKQFRVLREKDR